MYSYLITHRHLEHFFLAFSKKMYTSETFYRDINFQMTFILTHWQKSHQIRYVWSIHQHLCRAVSGRGAWPPLKALIGRPSISKVWLDICSGEVCPSFEPTECSKMFMKHQCFLWKDVNGRKEKNVIVKAVIRIDHLKSFRSNWM